MTEALWDLLYITDSLITITLKIFIIILVCKIIIGFRKNCNLLNKGELR